MDVRFEKKFRKGLKKGKFQSVIASFERRRVELESADNLDEFMRTYPGARCHERRGEQEGMFTVDLTGNYRLCFCLLSPFLLKEDGGIDTKSVVAVNVIEIDDPH